MCGLLAEAGALLIEAATTVHTGWMASSHRRIPVAGEVDDGG
jgi:hypothetical protein